MFRFTCSADATAAAVAAKKAARNARDTFFDGARR
ncbi:hypothetical protein SAMN05216251_103267 [Actinacidiphila alni]|uniref:Uncharacterized protein n=1 Tax=Actinacidiphila alni TaxID=380248 RepID=A0A1I2AX93_9ACTN|nr:hypothetical protein SAMN05216251_103267 [Actinacidiphila alni]